MKVLVVLVLAVFTGCNANLFSADEPKSKLDELTDAFWGSVNKARRTADDTLDKFMQTEIGQNVGARLAEGAHAASTYAEIAWDQLPTTVKDSMGSVGMLLYGISVQADEGLTTFKKKIEPFVERVAPVAEKVQSLLTQRAEQVAEVASPYVDKLIEKLDPMTQDVQTRLTNLQVQLGMYTVKKQLESTVEKMAPLAEQVTITLTARAEQLTDMASPYAERLKEKLEPVIHNMKTHLNALYQSTVKTN
uniref:Apolipoprotein Eb-like n=1 Tax=Labrus bergylta TaxID=56723 RepID=A0A3Q3KZ86_9LABR